MDRDPARPLSIDEAKARLRTAAQDLTLSHVIGRRTWSVLALSVAGGFVAGRIGIAAIGRTLLMQRYMPVVFAMLLGGHRESK